MPLIKYLRYNSYSFLTAFFVILFISCENDYSPKPRGYFRIDLPEKEYRLFDTAFPYSFEYPVYAKIVPDERNGVEPYWINIDYPRFNGRVYLSYKVINDNLIEYLEDSRTFVMKLIPKASNIQDSLILRRADKVFGLIYEIDGINAASPIQFFVTDSASHFLRGALYFNHSPNNDSMAPVIDFIRKDIHHLVETLEWKEI